MRKGLVLLFCTFLTITSFAGKIDTLTIHHPVMNRDIEVIVVSPSMTKANRHYRFPVVYMLHGAYNNARCWISMRPDLPEVADEMQMIFVTPNALNSWYFDSPKLKDFRYETFVAKELVEYVDSHYSTIPRREARAITGLSMGGHGALFLAFRHKDVFGACGSMSGGVDFRPFPRNWNIPDVLGEYAANKDSWDAHTVVNQISKIKNGDLAITIDDGEQDFFLSVNKSLHERLLGAGINHDWATRPGEHNSEYWGNSIDYHLLFFQKYFKRHHTTAQKMR
ncbi:MAG: alpha/beta hydrolase [Prevotella sp.]|jgi:S-formylglutathione hydrolase FrmB